MHTFNLIYFTKIIPGNAGQSASSPIKGYRKTPNAKRFAKYFLRRPGCDVFFAPEKRTTMVCSLCRTVMAEPNMQRKQRYRTCLDCKPKSDCMPASKITTVVSKRKLKRLRRKEKKRRENEQAMGQQMAPVNEATDETDEAIEHANQAVEPLNQQPIPNGNVRAVRLVSKLTHYVKNDEAEIRKNKHGKVVVVWNRDVNAGRNIMYVGKYQMFRRKLLFVTEF